MLAREVEALDWYHTLDLGQGVVTPGWLDTRRVADRVSLPPSLAGKRCLDVGTFNGFWAFEMERRGASEVVGDRRARARPLGLARRQQAGDEGHDRQAPGGRRRIRNRQAGAGLLASSASTAASTTSTRDDVGRFDLVYVGSLLVHLRDPVRALERVRSVCDGTLIVVDGIDLPLSLAHPRDPVARLDGRGRPWWWYPNAAGLARLVEVAGFEVTEGPRRLFIPPGPGWQLGRPSPRLLASREGRYHLTVAAKGDPHAVIVARPRSA